MNHLKEYIKKGLLVGLGCVLLTQQAQSPNSTLRTIPKQKTFILNPFKTPQGQAAYAQHTNPNLTTIYLQQAITFAKAKYQEEQKILAANPLEIIIMRNPSPTESMLQENTKKRLLNEFTHIGSQVLNPQSKHYDATVEKFKLKKEDCTTYVLEALAKTSQDTMYQQIYKKYVAGKFDVTAFPKIFSSYLHEHGYATIYIAKNTTSTKISERYSNGSRRGGLTKYKMRRVRNGTYYAPIDYVITDEDLEEPATKAFIQTTPKIVTVHDDYHMGFDDYGTFYEAHRNNTPTLENVYEKSDFYKGLLQEGTRNWKNAVLFVPRDRLNEFLATRIQ